MTELEQSVHGEGAALHKRSGLERWSDARRCGVRWLATVLSDTSLRAGRKREQGPALQNALTRIFLDQHCALAKRREKMRFFSRSTGAALFRFHGEQGASTVIFGEPGDAALRGVVTLEELGLILDPLRRELRPMPMSLMPLRPPSR
jgi:hypothetical protein